MVRGRGKAPTVAPPRAGVAWGLSSSEAAERLALAMGLRRGDDGFICWEALHDHRRAGMGEGVVGCCAVGVGACANLADYDLVERRGGLRSWLPHCEEHFLAAQGLG